MWYLFDKTGSDSLCCIGNLLKALHISHHLKAVETAFLCHPAHPAFFAYISVLRQWGVDADLYSGSVDDLTTIPTPSAANITTYFKQGQGYISKVYPVVIIEVDNEKKQITFIDPFMGETKNSFEDFAKRWDRFVLGTSLNPERAEKQDFEPHYLENKRFYRNERIKQGFVTLTGVGFLSYFLFQGAIHASFSWVLLAFLYLAGFCLSVMLIIASIKPLFAAKVCPKSKNIDCESVLQSPAAKVFGISFAEIGMLFFASLFLAHLFVERNQNFNSFVALLSLLSLPYACFSLYYQGVVLKKWCLLCVAVQGVLFSLAGYLFMTESLSLNVYGVAAFATALVGSSALWLFFKDYFVDHYYLKSIEHPFARIRTDPLRIKGVLAFSDKVMIPTFPEFLIFGNPTAQNQITLIVEPPCPHCANAIEKMAEYLIRFKNSVQFRVIITFDPQDKNSARIAKTIGYLNMQNPDSAHEAFFSWFLRKKNGKANLNEWLKSHSCFTIEDEAGFDVNLIEHLKVMGQAFHDAGKPFPNTPSILMRDVLFTEGLDLNTIQHLLEDLEDEASED